jgi:ketosteroid isomerase-like protein
MTYLEKAKDLYRMLGEGKMMDAFEKYYHEDVVMTEATGDSYSGKARNRERMHEWEESLEQMHDGGTGHITSNEDEAVTMVESWTDVSFKNGQRMKIEEIALQQWEGDQIIRERFYYNPGPMAQKEASE